MRKIIILLLISILCSCHQSLSQEPNAHHIFSISDTSFINFNTVSYCNYLPFEYIDSLKTVYSEVKVITKQEWKYLLYDRKNAEQLVGMGVIDSIPSLIILPDNFVLPEDLEFNSALNSGFMILEFKSGIIYCDNMPCDHYSDNTYDKCEWELMQNNGAIYLPALGYSMGSATYFINKEGYYWTSTLEDNQAYYLYFNTKEISLKKTCDTYFGMYTLIYF